MCRWGVEGWREVVGAGGGVTEADPVQQDVSRLNMKDPAWSEERLCSLTWSVGSFNYKCGLPLLSLPHPLSPFPHSPLSAPCLSSSLQASGMGGNSSFGLNPFSQAAATPHQK